MQQNWKLEIFGDNITKLIVPHQIFNCYELEATNFYQSGSKMKDLYCLLKLFKNNHKGSKVDNIVIHVWTNHFQRENPRENSRKICKLLQKVKYDFQDGVVYFSVILSKVGSVVFESIDYINETVFMCSN